MIVCIIFNVVPYLTSGLQLSGHENVGMGDWRATVPPLVKIVYLLHTKSCARIGLDFSLYLLCQVKASTEINTRLIFTLSGKSPR